MRLHRGCKSPPVSDRWRIRPSYGLARHGEEARVSEAVDFMDLLPPSIAQSLPSPHFSTTKLHRVAAIIIGDLEIEPSIPLPNRWLRNQTRTRVRVVSGPHMGTTGVVKSLEPPEGREYRSVHSIVISTADDPVSELTAKVADVRHADARPSDWALSDLDNHHIRDGASASGCVCKHPSPPPPASSSSTNPSFFGAPLSGAGPSTSLEARLKIAAPTKGPQASRGWPLHSI